MKRRLEDKLEKLKSNIDILDMIMHHIEVISDSVSNENLSEKLDTIFIMYNEALDYYNELIDNGDISRLKKYEIRLDNIYNRIYKMRELCSNDNDEISL